MAKIDIQEVEALLLQKKIDTTKVQEIVRDMEKIVEEIKEDRAAERGPKQKWEPIIIILDENNELKNKDLVGWIVNQKDGEDANLILSKLCDAARNQNEAAKRKRNIIENLTDLFECLKSKWLKEKNIKVKTKNITRVIITDGKMI
jgi:hypothetical protein